MNRRGFLSALALAPVAAVVAPAIKPAFATGGFIEPQYGYLVGETAGEAIMPLKPISAAVRCWPDFGVPYEVAVKGYDQALEDGDIKEDSDLTIKVEEARS